VLQVYPPGTTFTDGVPNNRPLNIKDSIPMPADPKADFVVVASKPKGQNTSSLTVLPLLFVLLAQNDFFASFSNYCSFVLQTTMNLRSSESRPTHRSLQVCDFVVYLFSICLLFDGFLTVTFS
jgi:hypothetical protein